ncbi:MAG: hypothetical protein JNM38_10020 [Acidobacteria bacterium]|nr:hypothetical protein [Acidobacteriota bacterium]
MRKTVLALLAVMVCGVVGTASAQPVRGLAWALVSTTAPSAFQFNSARPAGGSITVAYFGAGQYVVTIPDLGSAAGTAHAVAANGNHHCNVASWGPSGADLLIAVTCYSSTGTTTAGDFNVFYYKESRSETAWSSGYLWAQTASSTLGVAYDADAGYRWNSKGLVNTVERTATGRYRATFPGLAPLPAAPAVMVTAYGASNPARCRTNDYRPIGTDVIVDVACDAVDGTPVDSRFTLSFFTDVAFGASTGYENQKRGGYVYLDQPSTASVTPDLRFQYLSTGQPVRVQRTDVGRWSANFPATINNGYTTVQVSRFGSPGYCSVSTWVDDLVDGTNVAVECYAPDGSPADGSFVLLYMTSTPAGGGLLTPGPPGRGKAWTFSGSSTAPTIASDYDFNSTGATNAISRIGMGQYRVEFPGLGTNAGIVHVSAYDGTAYCKAHSWGAVGTTQEVYVLCLDNAGGPVDNRFTVLFYREGRAAATSNTGYARVMAPVSSTSSVYPAATPYAWNGRGGAAEIRRSAVGTYTVTFTSVVESPDGGSVLVTPYGATQTRCKVSVWAMPDATVVCHDPDGTPRDAEFGVSYFTDVAFGADSVAASDPGGYAWADLPASPAYPALEYYSLNSTGGSVTAERSAEGAYEMLFGGLKGYNKAIAFVGARGTGGSSTDAYCRLAGWSSNSTRAAAFVGVSCQGAVAPARDTGYVVTYLTDSVGAAPPTISDIANRGLAEGGTSGPIPFTIGDDATPASSLVVWVASSHPAMFSAPPTIVLGGSGTARTLTLSPTPGFTGTATLTVYVEDEGGLSSHDSFEVFVLAGATVAVTRAGAGTGTVTSTPFGITCGATCSGRFVTGASVGLTAIADTASTFTGWSGGGCSGTGSCLINLAGNTSVTANFEILPRTYYLAEGATGAFFDLDVVIANPNDVDVPVEMTFLDAAGHTYPLNFTLAAKRSRTIAVESEVPALASADVSTIVRSPTGYPLVVERSLFWDASYYGGHTGSAVDGPQTTWYFGEGYQAAPVFDTFILLANANATPATVTLTFLRQGGSPVTTTRIVGATSRANVWAAELPAELNGWSFATVVTSDIPIIAERAMYFGSPAFNGGHESAGVAAPATNWFHAEGRTGPFFDTYILIGNPGHAPANVNVRFLRAGDTPLTTSLTVGPQSRETIYVDGIPGLPNNDVSTEVTSDVPVISERSLYWSGGFDTWYEAHNSFGVTSTGLAWGLAEGRFGFAQLFETYILLTNPTATPTRVRVTFLRQGSRAPVVFEQSLAANERANVDMSHLLTAPDYDIAGERFGAIIESLDGVGIAGERAMYFSTGGTFWAGGTNATAVKLR